jgi:hypothetical protein
MTYKQILKPNGGLADCIIRLSDGATIPFDPDNTDYQAFLLWKSEGGVPTPADE